jgi:hypothetical protein
VNWVKQNWFDVTFVIYVALLGIAWGRRIEAPTHFQVEMTAHAKGAAGGEDGRLEFPNKKAFFDFIEAHCVTVIPTDENYPQTLPLRCSDTKGLEKK